MKFPLDKAPALIHNPTVSLSWHMMQRSTNASETDTQAPRPMAGYARANPHRKMDCGNDATGTPCACPRIWRRPWHIGAGYHKSCCRWHTVRARRARNIRRANGKPDRFHQPVTARPVQTLFGRGKPRHYRRVAGDKSGSRRRPVHRLGQRSGRFPVLGSRRY